MNKILESPQDFALRKKRADLVVNELKKLLPNAKTALIYGNEWELLVGVALSAQCTDKAVNKVTQKLFKKYKTIKDYAEADFDELCQDIHSTGFYRNKAKNLIGAGKKILADFNGKVPNTLEELITIPGVARKTANVVLVNAFGIVVGIAVDTHVIRLTHKFKLTTHTNPDKIEKELMELLPKVEWFKFTNRVIEYGRTYSPAHKKDDTDDPISQALIKAKLL